MTGPRATLRIPFADAAAAGRAAAALRPDDDAYVQTGVEGAVLVVEIRAPSVRSLLRALDDALGTSGVSEDLIRTPPFDAD